MTIPKVIYANLISFTFTKFILFFKRNEMIKFLKKLQFIDDKFLNLNLKFNYKHQQQKLTKTLLASLAFILAMNIFTFLSVRAYKVHLQPFTIFLQFWAFFASSVLTHQMIAGMIGIEHRFELINLYMKYHSTLMNSHVLKNIAEIHFSVSKLIKIFNKIFGVITLSTITITFVWFCIFIFTIATGNLKIFSQYLFLTIIDFIMYVMIIGISFLLIYHAEKVKKQGMMTMKYLYKMLHKVEDCRHREVIRSFISQIRDSNIEISCKFFNLNWSFVFKVKTRILGVVKK